MNEHGLEEDPKWDPDLWPKAFIDFLQTNAINPNIYLTRPKRYYCVLDKDLLRVLKDREPLRFSLSWAPSFFEANETDEPISANPLYRTGQILPMDPSSWLAVQNLSLVPTDHVLDLCCAPGTKTVLISRLIGNEDADDLNGSVTGVDISKERLASAVLLAKRYRLPRVRLFVADGTKFDLPVHLINPKGSRKGSLFNQIYLRSKRPIYSSSPFRKQPGHLAADLFYDKVLVDAQCTHDGSVKHIRKHVETDWREFDPEHYSAQGLSDLYHLQLQLLQNGFNRLRPGGILVYSTCSLSMSQNEDIISRFLQSNKKEAKLVDPLGPTQFLHSLDDSSVMRILPTQTMGGGFFLCRMTKLVLSRSDQMQ